MSHVAKAYPVSNVRYGRSIRPGLEKSRALYTHHRGSSSQHTSLCYSVLLRWPRSFGSEFSCIRGSQASWLRARSSRPSPRPRSAWPFRLRRDTGFERNLRLVLELLPAPPTQHSGWPSVGVEVPTQMRFPCTHPTALTLGPSVAVVFGPAMDRLRKSGEIHSKSSRRLPNLIKVGEVGQIQAEAARNWRADA